MKEQGLPEFDVPGWYGAFIASAVPCSIIEKLHTALATSHTDTEFRSRQYAGGIIVPPNSLSLAELQSVVARQPLVFARIVKRTNIRLTE